MIRDADDSDMTDVQRIYAHHVLNGLATFEEGADDGGRDAQPPHRHA